VQLWDDAGWEALSERHVRIARTTGALGDLPLALTQRGYLHLLTGELIAAASLVEEIRAATDATGSDLAPYGAVGLAALRGREAEAAYLLERTRTEVTRRGEGIGLSVIDWAVAVLCNGLGRYKEVCSAALRVAARPHDLNPSMWVMAEVIEAAVRAGKPELAADTHRRLMLTTRASGTDRGLWIAAHSQALLVEDQRAEDLYVEAIRRLGRTQIAVDLARAHLLYGEWLRRQRRRMDARAELRLAHELCSDFGMEAFAERTRVELEATASTPARGPWTRWESSLRRRRRFPPRRARPYQPRDSRSAVHQAPARSDTTCVRCSASSTSNHETQRVRFAILPTVATALFAINVALGVYKPRWRVRLGRAAVGDQVDTNKQAAYMETESRRQASKENDSA
jgi:hypothetical protein